MGSSFIPLASEVEYKPEDVDGYQCQHAFYSRRKDFQSDLLFVKEYVQLKDGRRLINLRRLVDHPRKYWITKPRERTYKDKLEWIELEKVDEFESPQWCLADNIARQLKFWSPRNDLRTLASTHNVYGIDISPTANIRHQYNKMFPHCRHPSSTVAVLDTEVNVFHRDKPVIIITVSYKNKAFVGYLKSWIGDIQDVEKQFMEKANEHLGETIRDRKVDFEVYEGETPAEICREAIMRLHEWKPDFVEIWNLDFDLTKLEEAFDREGYDKAEIFSDPLVPDEYKYFKYHRGKDTHVNQEGKKTKLKFHERWHTVDAPASFQWVDGMCYYYQKRKVGGQMRVGLDACLEREFEGKKSKLHYECGAKEGTVDWHRVMQKSHKIIYMVYAIQDCFAVEELDDKILDIASTIATDIGESDLRYLTSMPKQFVDAFHWELLEEQGRVLGSASNNLKTEIDESLINVADWIVALSSHHMSIGGMKVIKDAPNIVSNIEGHLADADVIRTYPMMNVNLNVSRETTYKEPTIHIEGMTEGERRAWGINFTGGEANCIELCTTGLGLPYPDEWVKYYREVKNRA